MKNKGSKTNTRIIKKYSSFLKEAKRQDDKSVDAALKAINRFEEFSNHKELKKFKIQDAINFKLDLMRQKSISSGKPFSLSTLNTTLHHLKAFFQWLAMQNGYRSKINYSDAEFFNLSRKDARIANTSSEKPVPTLDQITEVLKVMPSSTDIQMRDRAVVALTVLAAPRDGALASLKIKHLDLDEKALYQDAREVDTKYSKTFTTYLFPVGELPLQILIDWIDHLTNKLGFTPNDPLFPKTEIKNNEEKQFEAVGLLKEHWSNANPVRRIFKEAFNLARLPYFNPHSFRKTLVNLGEELCRTPEEFKAWSQNLGHESVLTTFFNYGTVPDPRQAKLLRKLAEPSTDIPEHQKEQFKLFMKFMDVVEKEKA